MPSCSSFLSAQALLFALHAAAPKLQKLSLNKLLTPLSFQFLLNSIINSNCVFHCCNLNNLYLLTVPIFQHCYAETLPPQKTQLILFYIPSSSIPGRWGKLLYACRLVFPTCINLNDKENTKVENSHLVWLSSGGVRVKLNIFKVNSVLENNSIFNLEYTSITTYLFYTSGIEQGLLDRLTMRNGLKNNWREMAGKNMIIEKLQQLITYNLIFLFGTCGGILYWIEHTRISPLGNLHKCTIIISLWGSLPPESQNQNSLSRQSRKILIHYVFVPFSRIKLSFNLSRILRHANHWFLSSRVQLCLDRDWNRRCGLDWRCISSAGLEQRMEHFWENCLDQVWNGGWSKSGKLLSQPGMEWRTCHDWETFVSTRNGTEVRKNYKGKYFCKVGEREEDGKREGPQDEKKKQKYQLRFRFSAQNYPRSLPYKTPEISNTFQDKQLQKFMEQIKQRFRTNFQRTKSSGTRPNPPHMTQQDGRGSQIGQHSLTTITRDHPPYIIHQGTIFGTCLASAIAEGFP
ncbi:putative signal peptide protein [Puccinia sorghi]|uniref:Putative signal peptide protein n=1 Tax=Puccinia sorghi TaxID=27349 RepID=A0A0L6VS38_9BASI|nr:putative signal peptide protein [Puccinia sorghi]